VELGESDVKPLAVALGLPVDEGDPGSPVALRRHGAVRGDVKGEPVAYRSDHECVPELPDADDYQVGALVRGLARLPERRMPIDPRPGAGLVDVEEPQPAGVGRPGLALSLPQQLRQRRVDDVDERLERATAPTCHKPRGVRRDLRIHPVVAPDRDEVAGLLEPGLAQHVLLGGVADDHGDALLAALLDAVGQLVLLDRHDAVAQATPPGPLPVSREPLGQEHAPRSEPAHDYVIAHQPHPHAPKLLARDRDDRAHERDGYDERRQHARHLECCRDGRIHRPRLEAEELERQIERVAERAPLAGGV
jgi:hypothetical protein